jgi:Tol biopolymer transport system component
MPAAGGDATQITTAGGSMAVESPDGKELFYRQSRAGELAIWKVPVQGGQPVLVTGPIHGWPSAFAVTTDGIYYTAPPHHSGDQRFIRFYSFSSGQSRPVVVTNRPFGMGMTISRDGRQIVFDQHDDVGSDLMIIENFRLP